MSVSKGVFMSAEEQKTKWNLPKMRRSRQALSQDECLEVLDRTTSGVLALTDSELGCPYQVPLSHARRDNTLIFHCASAGHKLELIRAVGPEGAAASFCVIDADKVVPESLTTYFRSVIALGHVRVVEDPERIRSSLMVLGERYWPGHAQETSEEIDRSLNRVLVLEFTIEALSGKQAIELVPKRTA